MNAARLVKGEPLVFHAEPRGCRQNQDAPLTSPWELERLTQVIAGIVLGLLQAEGVRI